MPCAESEEGSPDVCTASMDDSHFQLFTMFLQHSDNVCHFLQAELW